VRRNELIKQAGVEWVSSAQLMGMQLSAALLVLLIVQVLTSTIAVGCCFAVFAFVAPVAVIRRMRQRRQVALRELWPEAIDNLASAVRAGMSLPEGVSGLALRGPEPLRPPFARFGAAYRASGRFAECLDWLKADLADPVGDRVCETLRVAREVGGSDLDTVLRTLSELLRVDARTRSELETRQGWTVNAMRLTAAHLPHGLRLCFRCHQLDTGQRGDGVRSNRTHCSRHGWAFASQRGSPDLPVRRVRLHNASVPTAHCGAKGLLVRQCESLRCVTQRASGIRA